MEENEGNEEKLQKVQALRSSLRNGRNSSVSTASTDTRANDGDDDTAFRTTFQDAGGKNASIVGHSKQSEGDDRQSGSNGRSAETKPQRIRPANRRSSKSDSSSVDDPTEQIIGNVEADEKPKARIDPDAPEAEFKRKGGWPKGKPRNSAGKAAETKIPLIRKGNKLTEKEAKELSEPLISALESDFLALDTYLWERQKAAGKDTHEQPVWSDLDTEEITKLTNLMLRWGQHNEAAAAVTRAVIDASDYIAVGTIFIPRIKQSVQIMKETRKPRQKRGQREDQNK